MKLSVRPVTRIAHTLELELGSRVFSYLDIENSDWAYKMWFATARWWWDAETRSFLKETRPHMLQFIGEE